MKFKLIVLVIDCELLRELCLLTKIICVSIKVFKFCAQNFSNIMCALPWLPSMKNIHMKRVSWRYNWYFEFIDNRVNVYKTVHAIDKSMMDLLYKGTNTTIVVIAIANTCLSEPSFPTTVTLTSPVSIKYIPSAGSPCWMITAPRLYVLDVYASARFMRSYGYGGNENVNKGCIKMEKELINLNTSIYQYKYAP